MIQDTDEFHRSTTNCSCNQSKIINSLIKYVSDQSNNVPSYKKQL